MSINILGGVAKGFTLATPHTSITRPTSVLLKRRLFDYYQNLEDFYFYDLCAGSGSIGLEASSRGAVEVTFVESNIKAFNILKSNVKSFQQKYPESKLKYEKIVFEKWIDQFLESYQEVENNIKVNTILFFDPPYEKLSLYEHFFTKLKESGFKGIAIIEACRQKTMPQNEFESKFGKPDRNYQQGTSFLYLYDYNK